MIAAEEVEVEVEEELGETDSCHITYTLLPKAATRGYTESWVLFVKLKDFVKLIVLSLILVDYYYYYY